MYNRTRYYVQIAKSAQTTVVCILCLACHSLYGFVTVKGCACMVGAAKDCVCVLVYVGTDVHR